MHDNSESTGRPSSKRMSQSQFIAVAGEDLHYRSVEIDDVTPTGLQIARAARCEPPNAAVVLRVLDDGAMDFIRPDETVDLADGSIQFVVIQSDRIYFFKVDGERYEWPTANLTGVTIRRLAHVPQDMSLYLERTDQPDREVSEADMVNLDQKGTESLITHKKVWKLNVQGVVLELTAPTILVREALILAGINPDLGWQIILKLAGGNKEKLELTAEIDLRKPGIEKIRLTPNNIHNGEAPPAAIRAFALLDADETHLNRLGLRWETIIEQQRRWLLIEDYPLPAGYAVESTKLALEIPPNYPGSQIYGFYAYPPLALAINREIANTQLRGVLLGVEFHGWSRYRGPAAPWNPAVDNVMTQLALVDAALAKEVGE